MQYGFYINSAKCTGCKTCQVSCKDEKDLDIGPKFRRVYEYGGGDWQQVNGLWQNDTFAYYLSVSCNHCDEPTCVHGCPTGAMHKRTEDGLVVVNQDVCIGCRYCEMRCPYGAPQFDHQKRVMSKCDGCYERVSEGLKPVCVDSCPQRALEFDDITVLREKYGHERDIAPLPQSSLTKPNIVINVHAHAKPSGDTVGRVLNPEEV
ncbi:anaerobic dimethyl sulfoxide reductase subunit B (iron-sulfur subunit) [Orbus hercynius]|uniref:Anaerobic dimethyl sulfoxide reductase subunit B (Iron-sulfur subunit) n=1 Tax=Orbus hercynius TaxID=593135 RepID=A0A495RJV5_9GAMM|nr:DMSO/selenate family reductase complex B subunit [Orbus hercynius]RKS87580.1 anaerobic dimethyl sulfoxide reductase subunit B (iron-sulfur subunit) [Orbus hercynius]